MSAVDFETAARTTFESQLEDGDFTDDELAVLALAADPDQEVDSEAVPLSGYEGQLYGPLPSWYMPAPVVRGRSGWRTAIVLGIVVSLLLIEALGLCVAYGQLVTA
jgi:hypothetical protein